MTTPRLLGDILPEGRAYNTMERGETQQRDFTVIEFGAVVQCWVEGIDIVRRALDAGWELTGTPAEVMGKTFSLWLGTAGLAASKVALDHSLGEMYFAAFWAERFTTETAIAIQALAVDPSHAEDWFGEPKRPDLHERSPAVWDMVRFVRKAAQAESEREDLKETLKKVQAMATLTEQLGVGAHPTLGAVMHVVAPDLKSNQQFPVYSSRHSIFALRDGLIALHGLLEGVRNLRLDGALADDRDTVTAWDEDARRWSHELRQHASDLDGLVPYASLSGASSDHHGAST